MTCRLYHEAKGAGLFINGQDKLKGIMYSAMLHMFARIQDFETVAELMQDVRTYSVHVKMNTLVVRPCCCVGLTCKMHVLRWLCLDATPLVHLVACSTTPG